jgi:hypothetical protein
MTQDDEKSSERGEIEAGNSSEWKMDRESLYVLWSHFLFVYRLRV